MYKDGKHGCEFCRYAVTSENQEPCYSCSHRYKDNFRPKKVDGQDVQVVFRRLNGRRKMTNEEAEEYAKNITYRNAVYNALQGRCIPYRKATLIKLHELLDMIEPLKQDELSSVTPSRPKGYWICHRDHCENLGVIPSGLGVYEWCSNCDCGIDIREWQRNHYNYCPNCGADMRESDKHED